MPTYRYYTIPLLISQGEQPVTEIELTSVNMDRALAQPGNLSGTYRLGHSNKDEIVVNGTVPGYHAIVCKRDGYPIWAGPIWSQTYESQGQTLQITAQTYDSLWPWIHIAQDTSFTASGYSIPGYAGLFAYVIPTMMNVVATQLSGGTNFGILPGAITYPGEGYGLLPYAYKATDNKTLTDFWDDIVGHTDGLLQPTIAITPGTGDAVIKTAFLYGVEGVQNATHSNLYLDYPGNVSAYWYPMSASGSGVRHVAIGAGGASGSANSNMTLVPTGLPTTGWPSLTKFSSYSNYPSIYLPNAATFESMHNRMPKIVPTFELMSPNKFEHWNDVGKPFTFNVRDQRFPNGYTVTTELAGWSLTPEGPDSPEIIRVSAWGDN